jgi:hypothetical protein
MAFCLCHLTYLNTVELLCSLLVGCSFWHMITFRDALFGLHVAKIVLLLNDLMQVSLIYEKS